MLCSNLSGHEARRIAAKIAKLNSATLSALNLKIAD
jgi:hypothetical protein